MKMKCFNWAGGSVQKPSKNQQLPKNYRNLNIKSTRQTKIHSKFHRKHFKSKARKSFVTRDFKLIRKVSKKQIDLFWEIELNLMIKVWNWNELLNWKNRENCGSEKHEDSQLPWQNIS